MLKKPTVPWSGMKLDPKYFNLFIACCAVVALILIAYGSIRYHQNQERIFRDNIEQSNLDDYHLPYMAEADSLWLADLKGESVVIQFWSTWSGRSRDTHSVLQKMSENYPELTILAVAVRDDDELVLNYIRENSYSFSFVNGTGLYHDLQVPGVPSHILLDREGRLFDLQIGGDDEKLTKKIEALIDHEQN